MVDPHNDQITLCKEPLVAVPEGCYAVKACAWLPIDRTQKGGSAVFISLVQGWQAGEPDERLLKALTALCLGMPHEYFRGANSPIGTTTTHMLSLQASSQASGTEMMQMKIAGIDDFIMEVGVRRVLLLGDQICVDAWPKGGMLHMSGAGQIAAKDSLMLCNSAN